MLWLKNFLLLTFLCFGLMVPITHAHADMSSAQGIVAVVNDEAISAYDLVKRMDLIIVSSKLENTPEVRARLVPQVLQSLINEKLQLQEAERLELTVTEEDLQGAYSQIEQQNGIEAGNLESSMRENGLNFNSLRQQIRSQVVWRQLVRAKAGPLLTVDDTQVDEILNDLQSQETTTEYRYAEIFLNVENPQQEERVKNSAQELFDQLQSGADFQKLSKSFSERPSAADGGKINWIRETELEEQEREILTMLPPNHISKPVRIDTGYLIILALDKRIREVNEDTLPSRAKIKYTLRQQRLSQVARKYANDLRRDAIIDIRITPEANS